MGRFIAGMIGVFLGLSLFDGIQHSMHGPEFRADAIKQCLASEEWCSVEKPELHALLFQANATTAEPAQ